MGMLWPHLYRHCQDTEAPVIATPKAVSTSQYIQAAVRWCGRGEGEGCSVSVDGSETRGGACLYGFSSQKVWKVLGGLRLHNRREHGES